MSQLRDLPPVSGIPFLNQVCRFVTNHIIGAIIWARQIERQLSTYMQRVEDVLGKSWESDAEGQKLKAEGDQFRQKLNTEQVDFLSISTFHYPFLSFLSISFSSFSPSSLINEIYRFLTSGSLIPRLVALRSQVIFWTSQRRETNSLSISTSTLTSSLCSRRSATSSGLASVFPSTSPLFPAVPSRCTPLPCHCVKQLGTIC